MMIEIRRVAKILILPVLLFVNSVNADNVGKSDVEVTLKQYQVVKHNKTISLEPIDRIKPGDIVEYQATYHNVSKHNVHQLFAKLPIPAETEYITGSAKPTSVQASIDGIAYAPVPLRKQYKSVNGVSEEHDIPVSEYRNLQWAIGDLAAGQSVTVSARIQLAPLGSAAREEKK